MSCHVTVVQRAGKASTLADKSLDRVFLGNHAPRAQTRRNSQTST
jgi:hypothetical protein